MSKRITKIMRAERYYEARIVLELIMPLLASQPDLREKDRLAFIRDEEGNPIPVHQGVLPALIGEACFRIGKLPKSIKKYIHVDPESIKVRGDFSEIKWTTKATKGEVTYECLKKGSEIEMILLVPGNLLPQNKLKKMLDFGGKMLGIGAQRRGPFGKFKIKEFEVLGEV